VKILGEVRTRYGFKVLGYVIMPEHVHILINELAAISPAKIVQIFKQRVSRRKRGKKRVGLGQLALGFPEEAGVRRFWQRRYYDFNLYSEKKLREKLDYVHMNPVRERLVASARLAVE
jgi:putative transposase